MREQRKTPRQLPSRINGDRDMEAEQYENATIYLGDCREIFQNLPEMQAVVTDPLYGFHYVTKRRKIMERPEAIR